MEFPFNEERDSAGAVSVGYEVLKLDPTFLLCKTTLLLLGEIRVTINSAVFGWVSDTSTIRDVNFSFETALSWVLVGFGFTWEIGTPDEKDEVTVSTKFSDLIFETSVFSLSLNKQNLKETKNQKFYLFNYLTIQINRNETEWDSNNHCQQQTAQKSKQSPFDPCVVFCFQHVPVRIYSISRVSSNSIILIVHFFLFQLSFF